MVVDPPDGRVPVMKWAEDKRDYDLEHIPDAPEHETPWVRCITRGYPAGMFPAGYNNAYEIIQIPGYVVIVLRDDSRDANHPDRRAPAAGCRASGSGTASRAADGKATRSSWRAPTTTTRDRSRRAPPPAASAASRRSESMHVVERFTRSDANTIDYSVTITDPKVYSKPWTVKLPLNRDDTYQMFEYSCHEGNYAMPNALSFGRKRDLEAVKSSSNP